MRLQQILPLRFRSLFRRSKVEQELSEELQFHLEQQVAENLAAGMGSREARDMALRTIGNVEHFKEECRDTRAVEWVGSIFRDVAYAGRSLRQNRAFASVAILSLALGIGVNTALFSVIDAVMLKLLPVTEPERLMVISRMNSSGEIDSSSYPLFEEVRDRMPGFSGVLAALHGADRVEATLPDGQLINELQVKLVSGNYFEVLGVRPALGRALRPSDDSGSGPEFAAVVSHRFWTRRLNQNPGAVGQQIRSGPQIYSIVGVAPPEFFGEAAGSAPDIWIPMATQPGRSRGISILDKPNVSWLRIMGRLAPGVDEPAARAAAGVFFDQLKQEPGRLNTWVKGIGGIALSPGLRGLDDLRESYSRPLRILAATAGLLLLIACANVANLLLARGAQRQREIAIRLAIGAKRSRIVRQLMTENLLVACIGGVLGLAIAFWTTKGLLILASTGPEPMPLNAVIDWRVLLFTATVCVVSSLTFGIVPAIRSTSGRANLTVTFSKRRNPILGRALVIGQVAVCVLLLSGAGLLGRTLYNLRAQDFGFRTERLVQVRVDAEAAGYKKEQLREVYTRVLAGVRSAPGVLSAAMSHSGFATGTSRTCCVAVEGYTPRPGESRQVRTNLVHPDYFDTLGTPRLLGRAFTLQDEAEQPRVAILNKTAARQYFGSQSPVGKRFGWGDPPKVTYNIEIVGVVEDVSLGNLRDPATPVIYFPTSGGRTIHVRTAMDPSAVAGTIRQAISKADSSVTYRGMRTIGEILNGALAIERMMATLAAFFGLLALALAAVGLYGIVDYSVKQRIQEIGVRMALGARRSTIAAMISREVALLVVIGVGLGIPAAVWATPAIASLLFGVDATDVWTLSLAVLVLAIAAAVAALAPGRRAASVDPSQALRAE